MKKLKRQHKKYLHARARYAVRAKKRSGKPRSASHHFNTLYSRSALYRPPKRKFFASPPPVNFNLQYENCENVISYINSIKKAASKNRDILINLANVTDIREGAIAMLLSVMKEISNKKISVRGTLPINKDAKTVLENSGFLEFVESANRHNSKSKNVMRTGKKGNPSSQLGTDVRNAMNTVWGGHGRNPPLRAAIYEMIRNSCDHAYKNENQLAWHLAISHDESKNLVKFSFVDNGNGIIETMTKRKSLLGIMDFFKSNSDLLDTAFKGGIESRTRLPWRGKGLPAILENLTDNYIKNLLVITNDVFLHFDKGLREDLGIRFEGTYYYWEVDTTCEKICFTD